MPREANPATSALPKTASQQDGNHSVLPLRLVPRAYAAAGSVHAILAQTSATPLGQRRRDREDAKNWYQRAVSAWEQLSRHPEFSTFNRKDMEVAVTALASASQVRQ